MEWTKTAEGWRSGPYLIELLEPGQWALYITPTEDSAVQLVRAVPETTGRSLRRMKAKAASLERRREESAKKRKRLMILGVSMIAFVLAAGGSGQIAAIATIVSFGVMLWAAPKLVVHDRGSRPWEALRELYQ